MMCRTPRGVRELKFAYFSINGVTLCRTPRGVRELKWSISCISTDIDGRTPRGVRELKFNFGFTPIREVKVALRVGCVS